MDPATVRSAVTVVGPSRWREDPAASERLRPLLLAQMSEPRHRCLPGSLSIGSTERSNPYFFSGPASGWMMMITGGVSGAGTT